MRAAWPFVFSALVACGGAPSKTTEVTLAPTPSASAAPAVSAAPLSPMSGSTATEVMRSVGKAKIVAVIEVSELGGPALAGRFLEVLPFHRSMAEAGADVKVEVDRVLLAEKSLSGRGAVTVYQHHIDEKRIDHFLALAIDESVPRGDFVVVNGHKCAHLFHRGLSGVACPVRFDLLMVSFRPEPEILGALAASSGIPRLSAGTTLRADFAREADGAFEVWPFPDRLRDLELVVTGDHAGGFDIAATGEGKGPLDVNDLRDEVEQRLRGRDARARTPLHHRARGQPGNPPVACLERRSRYDREPARHLGALLAPRLMRRWGGERHQPFTDARRRRCP